MWLFQSWYDDDFSTKVPGAYLKTTIARIESLGPACDLFIKPDISQFVIYLGVSLEMVRAATSPLECSQGEGERQIGGFVSSEKAKNIWVDYKLEAWVEGVKRLEGFSISLPKMEYAGLMVCLQK